MLVPIQTSGTRLPLFFIHGVVGIMPLASTLARALGPDQPFYIFHANGVDGRQPIIDNMPDLVRAYVEDIQQARPSGPVAIGGMCEGSLAALEIGSALKEKGRQVAPLILADPQPMPPGYVRSNYVDVHDPAIARNLQQKVCEPLLQHASHPYNDMPFDARDQRQLETAVAAGVGSLITFCRHMPRPYSGPTRLILSAKRAAMFFQAQAPWQNLLRGPRIIHVLPCEHPELFRSAREYFARALKFMMDETCLEVNFSKLQATSA